MIGYGLWSGLFFPHGGGKTNANNGSADSNTGSSSSSLYTPARIEYKYDIITLLGLPNVMERSSSQAQAVDWLAFQDEPLSLVEDSVTSNNNANDNESSDADADDSFSDNLERLQQRYSLVVWYFDQGGPKLWTSINRDPSSGWINFGSGVNECDWEGIECDDDTGSVIGIRLSSDLGIVLTGSSLTTELGLLTSLRHIDFSDQRLQGTIPKEWSKMTDLQSLSMSKNQLQTTIPEWIGDNWTKLEKLALAENLCYGSIPSSLSTLTGLRHVDVQQNQLLTGRFDDALMISSPPMSLVADTIEYIDISYTNLIGSLPDSTDTLQNLKTFRAWNTRGLEGSIPPEISSWSSLEVFSVDQSLELSGSVPTTLGLLTGLKTLAIRYSREVRGTLPTEIGLLTNLETLDFAVNSLTGTLPVEYSQLTKLEYLDFMANTEISGTLPSEYGNLVNLKYMDLRGTEIVGEVSSEVCDIDFEEILVDCLNSNGKTTSKMNCECCSWCQ